MSNIPIIGVMQPHESCLICYGGDEMPDVANEITMDLLLSRKTAEEIVRYARTFYVPFYTEPELEHLVSHAAHCDSAMVPDDYVLNPDKYERGEHYLYQRARSRDEDDLGQV